MTSRSPLEPAAPSGARLKIVSVVGARPQFVKAAAVSRRLRQRHDEVLVHTGQHYDEGMSAVFFRELAIPDPEYHLGVGSARHGAQTGAMLERIEDVLLAERPDWVLVYGDTNSTLAGALAAAKLHVPVAHVEAGLRSFNRRMPEEVNRVLTDHVSALLLCPSDVARRQLAAEGVTDGVHVVGDVMVDAFGDALLQARACSDVVERMALAPGAYWLATVHRAENTDAPARLRGIMAALAEVGTAERPVVFPVHPRTRAALAREGWSPANGGLRLCDPVGYLDMVRLQASAAGILTDSGGVQKEAYWSGVPCTTLRDETEWVETVDSGWNVLAGADPARIVAGARRARPQSGRAPVYGEPGVADAIVDLLERAPIARQAGR